VKVHRPCLQGLRWEAVSPRPGMTNTYLRFMNAAYKINPGERLCHAFTLLQILPNVLQQ
jgi:hypothetical protein